MVSCVLNPVVWQVIISIRREFNGVSASISNFQKFDCIGFDMEAKSHFYADSFADKPCLSVESCICDSRTSSLSQSYIQRSREME